MSDSHGALLVDCVPPDGGHAARATAQSPATNDPVSAAARTRALGLTCRNTLCVRADSDLVHTASAVHRLGTAHVAVVDPELRALGIVPDDAVERAGRGPAGTSRASAGDVMRPVRVTLPTDVTVSLASAAMAETGAEEVPLVARDGDIVAVLRAIDLIRWFASLDGYVLTESVDSSLDQPTPRR